MQNLKVSYFMSIAIRQAKIAYENGEVPVGVVIENNGLVLTEASNQTEALKSAINHGEILAIQQATEKLQSKYLEDCNMYVTLEPCHMCMGAISLSKIRRLFFGAYNKKFGSVEHNGRITQYLNYRTEIYGGIMEYECQEIIKSFFKNLRAK
jgi:tRNA(adenine34) deaminase